MDSAVLSHDAETQPKQQKRSKGYSKKRREAARAEHTAVHGIDEFGGPPKQCAQKRKRQAQVVHTDYTFIKDVSDRRAPVTKAAFTGKPAKKARVSDGEITKDMGLREYDLRLIDWDGK